MIQNDDEFVQKSIPPIRLAKYILEFEKDNFYHDR